VASALTPARLHHLLLAALVEHGFAPTNEVLAERLDVPLARIEAALHELAAQHGILLHPGTARPWAVHPFSLAPTGHVLHRDGHTWWSPCVWCALGAATLLGGEVTLFTTLGSENRPVELPLVDGQPREASDVVVHFPIPMTRAWDNVAYTCSTMLAFASSADVDGWSRRHAIPRGDVQPIARVARLARAWYADHLRPDWRKWTVEEARALFARFELTHPVWELPASGQRF
jgi:hypothetical protein